MGTDKATFVEVLWGATGSDVTGSDVSHVTGSDHVRCTFENFHLQNVFFYIFTLLMFKIRQQLTKIESINLFVIICG